MIVRPRRRTDFERDLAAAVVVVALIVVLILAGVGAYVVASV